MKFSNPTGMTRAQRAEAAKNKRVVIVEDQRMVAEFLAAHCRGMDMEVVANCATCQEALAKVKQHAPELVLLDISLPDGDGLELAKALLAARPQPKIIAISSHRDPWTLLQVQRVGLHGFVDKTDQRPEVLTEAIGSVLTGHVYYTPVVNDISASLRRDPNAFVHVLSDYETRVLALIGESKTDEEIAGLLGVSSSTIQSRRRDIMGKLGIHSTPKLIHYAIVQGLTRADRLRTL